MNPDQFEELKKALIEANDKAVEKGIETHVNGKIRTLQKSFDEHIEEIQPVIDVYKGAGTLGGLVVGISKVIVAFGIIGGAIYSFIHFK